MLKKRSSRIVSRHVAASLALLPLAAPARAAITLYDKDGLSLATGGFVEMDSIFDSTRSFNEIIGNGPVAQGANGDSGRATFSIRNSRLFFDARYTPESDGWSTRGYFEFDLLGYNPAPSSGGNVTEAGFLNNATFRVRHAYLEAKRDNWTVLAGQTWELFGWQPYYFMTTADIMPIPATVYTRTPQLRLTRAAQIADVALVEAAIAVARPPQRDSGLADLQAGIRVSDTALKASSGLGSSGQLSPQPLSLGISGLFREIEIPDSAATTGANTRFPAAALAVNTLIPLVPAREGGLSSLAFIGAFTTGSGYGDQFSGWTGGTASNLDSAATGSVTHTLNAEQPLNLDGGIGDFDSAGNFHLIQLMSYNLNLQYTLPLAKPTWIDVGYGRLSSNNMYQLANDGGKGSSGQPVYTAESDVFANVFRDLTGHVRVSFELARVRTDYASSNITFDNRCQLSGWFIF